MKKTALIVFLLLVAAYLGVTLSVGDVGLKTHIGGCVLRRPIGNVPTDLAGQLEVLPTDEYRPFTKRLTVCGITLIAADDVPDSFMVLVGTCVQEMLRPNGQVDEAQQEALIKHLYRYRAVIPLFDGEDHALVTDNEEQWTEIERRSSVCDIIMYGVEGQVIEVVEHILHTVTDVGMHYQFPEQWGLTGDTDLWQAMNRAISKGHYNIESYAELKREARGVYDRVLVQEFAYWYISTQWGIHEAFGPREDEWTIVTPEELERALPEFTAAARLTLDQVLRPPSQVTLQKLDSIAIGVER